MKGEQTPLNIEQQNNICMEIADIRTMINHFIQLGYRKEVAFWRRVLQAAKVKKRGTGHHL